MAGSMPSVGGSGIAGTGGPSGPEKRITAPTLPIQKRSSSTAVEVTSPRNDSASIKCRDLLTQLDSSTMAPQAAPLLPIAPRTALGTPEPAAKRIKAGHMAKVGGLESAGMGGPSGPGKRIAAPLLPIQRRSCSAAVEATAPNGAGLKTKRKSDVSARVRFDLQNIMVIEMVVSPKVDLSPCMEHLSFCDGV